MKKILLLIVSIFCFSINASQNQDRPMLLTSVEKQVASRWNAFQANREFKPFEIGKSDAILKEELEEIKKTRELLWTTVGYETADALILGDLVRAPGCAAFAYNNTVPSYNASTLVLGGKAYIACEGPRSKDIPSFFKLLSSHQVTHLVRLTDSYEGEKKKCHPYWEGLLTESPEGEGYLSIPTEEGIYSIRAFSVASWRDHEGVDSSKLLALVLQIRQELEDTNGLLAVHCSAGVGRTGTFLASLAIVDAIDTGLPFSIEEIVYRLSLQRVNTVYTFGQYITLHRLAESYLNLLELR